jgi:hypothetical protein
MGSFKCLRCGSDDAAEDLVVLDQGHASPGRLVVLVGLGDPDAVLLKEPEVVPTVADACRACGALQFRVDPVELGRREERLRRRRSTQN